VLPFVLLNTANVNPEHVATYVAVLPAILAAATVFSARKFPTWGQFNVGMQAG